ncbi:hypothetical protein ACGFX7_06160 [Streptomyces harbinensis]|uniref:hypothetical protein n=1 Tax=Streptomyces harbinensis TaxID=1176198 RepID=UPI003714D15B
MGFFGKSKKASEATQTHWFVSVKTRRPDGTEAGWAGVIEQQTGMTAQQARDTAEARVRAEAPAGTVIVSSTAN